MSCKDLIFGSITPLNVITAYGISSDSLSPVLKQNHIAILQVEESQFLAMTSNHWRKFLLPCSLALSSVVILQMFTILWPCLATTSLLILVTQWCHYSDNFLISTTLLELFNTHVFFNRYNWTIKYVKHAVCRNYVDWFITDPCPKNRLLWIVALSVSVRRVSGVAARGKVVSPYGNS